jgi:hypothetical protein
VQAAFIRFSTNQVDAEGKDDGYFNGKNHKEKDVLGDREVFKNFVGLSQKSNTYWRGIHAKRIVGSAALF